MRPADDGGTKGSGGGDVVATVGAMVGEELAETDLPRSPLYPTRGELEALDRRVGSRLATAWREWIDQIFRAANAARAAGVTHSDIAGSSRSRAELLATLERRRPGTAVAEGLSSWLTDDARLAALVDALEIVDQVVELARPDEP